MKGTQHHNCRNMCLLLSASILSDSRKEQLSQYVSAGRNEAVLLMLQSNAGFEGVVGMKDAQHHYLSNMRLLLSASMMIES